MAKQVTFFHGGGSRQDYEADEKLVDSLRLKLGTGYVIRYPYLPNDGSPDMGRREQISHEIATDDDDAILVAHSLGASMLLAFLSEMPLKTRIRGVFLIATPFWKGDEDWVEAFKLKPGFAQKMDPKIPLFFYHSRDDDEVPFGHMDIYQAQLPWATFREIATGGHQFNNDLTIVAKDIQALA